MARHAAPPQVHPLAAGCSLPALLAVCLPHRAALHHYCVPIYVSTADVSSSLPAPCAPSLPPAPTHTRWEASTKAIRSVDFSAAHADGVLAACDEGGACRLWSAHSGELIAELQPPQGGPHAHQAGRASWAAPAQHPLPASPLGSAASRGLSPRRCHLTPRTRPLPPSWQTCRAPRSSAARRTETTRAATSFCTRLSSGSGRAGWPAGARRTTAPSSS